MKLCMISRAQGGAGSILFGMCFILHRSLRPSARRMYIRHHYSLGFSPPGNGLGVASYPPNLGRAVNERGGRRKAYECRGGGRYRE